MTTRSKLRHAAGLQVRRLSVSYGPEPVLRDLSFTLPAGASLAIVGESGCGKTTLLTTLAGLLEKDSGDVLGSDASGAAIPRLHSSFVWQNLGLLPWKTVRDNLALPLKLRNARRNPAESTTLVEAMLDELGLSRFAGRTPAELSGGQRQRLAIGRALIAAPDVLFMDEPFSALDALRRERLQDFLADMQRRRPLTMIFVTHDIPEAAFLASHILLLAASPPRVLELYENPSWEPDRHSGDRESPKYAEAIRHVHARLREACAAANKGASA